MAMYSQLIPLSKKPYKSNFKSKYISARDAKKVAKKEVVYISMLDIRLGIKITAKIDPIVTRTNTVIYNDSFINFFVFALFLEIVVFITTFI
jgi:hypothetical protein